MGGKSKIDIIIYWLRTVHVYFLQMYVLI
uniref:Uncharacterized protein n=1 Tax=Anguilla anguilla TaxID=7936 RepID=A0A0E9VR86_ANGAN